MKLSLLFSCALLFLGACSSSSDSTTADGGDDALADGGDAGSAANDAASDAPSATDGNGDAPSACNTVADAAPAVTVRQVASAPPTPSGGTIADGKYFMTDVSVYTGPNGPSGPGGSAQTTIEVSGSTIQVASSGTPATRTTTLATSGTSFTATDTCPDSQVMHGSYTATTTTLLIFLDGGTDDAGARTVVETFTKQ